MHPTTHRALSRPKVPLLRWIGLVTNAAILAGCASTAYRSGATPADTASPTPSDIVLPAPGTAAIENGPICQFAHNTAYPAVKRSSAIDECIQLLSRATDPVTKPAALPPPSTRTPPFQPSAPQCTSDSIRAEFRGGGYGSGGDFGGIWIWNPAAQPCTLHAPVAFTAQLPDGSPDPAAQTNRTISFPPTTLPANMPPPPPNAQPDSYMFAGLMGLERDDPTQPNGSCRTRDEVTPTKLTLTLGTVTLTVDNHTANTETKDVTAIYGCHGLVLLEGIDSPSIT